MERKKMKDSSRPFGSSIAIGFGTEVIISVIGAVIMTLMLINETVAVSSMQFLAHVMQFLSTVIGGIIACTLARGKYALTAGLVTVLYCFLLIGASVLIYDSAFGSFWTSLLSICLGYVVTCTICITKTTKRRNRKRVHR